MEKFGTAAHAQAVWQVPCTAVQGHACVCRGQHAHHVATALSFMNHMGAPRDDTLGSSKHAISRFSSI